MNQSISLYLQQFGLIVAIMAYVTAVLDWYRVYPYELNSGRRPSLLWAGGATLLVVVMIGLVAAWEGLRGVGPFLGQMSCGWLLRAFALLFLVQSGGYWAEALHRQPYRLDRLHWRGWPWRWLLGWLVFMLVWTAFLISIVPNMTTEPNIHASMGIGDMPPLLQWPFVIGVLTLAPIFEECLYRHYLLFRVAALFPDRYRKLGVAFAIALASLVWAVAHHGLLEPYWLKLAQTFILGLVLGATAWRHGLAAAISLHWAFNMTLIPMLILMNHT